MAIFLSKLLGIILLVLAGVVVLSLDYEFSPGKNCEDPHFDFGTRLRISVKDPDIFRADGEIKSVQKYQTTHRDLGFLWKKNIRPEDNAVIKWGDMPAGALSTDSMGFANSPEAIEELYSGRPVDIIGVGASFMGGAQGLFYDYFGFRDIFYYNMAGSRYTLPQYNIALKNYALPLKPGWVIYGMNESSFQLMDDFEQWKNSEWDWFSFHGGSWAGPARKSGYWNEILRKNRLMFSLFWACRNTLLPPVPDNSPARQKMLTKKAYAYIKEAFLTAKSSHIHFMVLLIPSKARMIQGPSEDLYLFEGLVPMLEEGNIPYIDLRKAFGEVEDPRTLYFNYDAHWNRKAVYIAARKLLDRLEVSLPQNKTAGGQEP